MIRGGGSKFSASTSGSLRKIAEAAKRRAYDQFDAHRAKIVMALTEKVLSRTPVWEGETIVNWQWTVGQPSSTHLTEIASGPPGHTNDGAGGPPPPSGEPRRAANEDVARASMIAALAAVRGKAVDLWLTNNGEIAQLIEYGGAPTPGSSRQPAGVLRVAIAEIMIGILG